MAVVRVISQQMPELQKKLEYHWQNYNPIQQSALPLQALANDAWLKGTKPKDARHIGLPITSHMWEGLVDMFRAGHPFPNGPSNLKTPGCESSAPGFQRVLSPAAWKDMQSRFYRGTLDAEFLES